MGTFTSMASFEGCARSSAIEVALRAEQLVQRSRERLEQTNRRVQASRLLVLITATLSLKPEKTHHEPDLAGFSAKNVNGGEYGSRPITP